MRSINYTNHAWVGVLENKTFLKNAVIIISLVVFIIPLSQKKAFAQRSFFMERPKLAMDLSFEYEKDIRSGPFTDRETITRKYIEKLDIETFGWVYHPALLIFRLGYLPEWEQSVQIEQGADRRISKPFLNGYFTEFTFLKYKPYTLILSANKDSTTTRSNFAERSKSETDTYGARLLLKYPILPTNLSFFHTEGVKTGFYEAENRKDQILMNMRHDKYLGTTVLDTSYFDSTDTTQQDTIETNQFRAALNNNYYFTEEKDVVLNSILGYEERDSTNTVNRRYHILENLRWINTYNLTTNYTLRYDKNNIFDKLKSLPLRTESKSVGFNLTHLLYENLKTTIDLDARENNSSSARNDIYGSRVDFNYTRRIPSGVLNLASGFDYRIFDTRPRGDTILVIDEPLVLQDGVTTFLVHENINPASIVIEDEIGHRFIEGIDYTIVTRGSQTGIKPEDSSSITDTGKILTVDYEYRAPAFDYSSFGQSYGINLSLWKIWRFYYLLSLSKQKFISGDPPESLNDDSFHTAGAEVEWKWNKAMLEWNDQYTDTVPTKKWTFTDIITLRPNDRSFWTFSAKYGETRFKDTLDLDKSMGFKSGFQMLAGERGYWDVQLFFDKISGTTDRITTKGLTSVFEWSYMIYTFNITYDFRHEDDEVADETFNNNYFLFNIKRTLF
ncbi:MAG: hypothetical protein C4538_06655 [Nitrospiraceae bacterium]|nr:MAG: hypothetical protein C4538_06655 [Nitrospiraceae bacterium]